MESLVGRCNSSSCSVCPKVSSTEKKILAARRHLESLLVEREELKSQQNKSHDPYVLRLPVEISSRIFSFCLDRRTPGEVYILKRRKCEWYHDNTRPSDLASVCRGWRSIALSTPQLWTRIHVRERHASDSGYLDSLNRLLLRSGTLPLSFALENRFKQTYRILPSIQLLNEQSARWYIVHLSTTPHVIPLLKGCGMPVNLLNTVVIRKRGRRLAPEQFRFQLTAGPPSILRLKCSGFGLKSLGFDWSKTTTIDLSYVTSPDFFEILLAAPQLESLRIDLCPDDEVFNEEPVRTISAQALRSVDIHLDDPSDEMSDFPSFSHLLGNIVAPKLNYLRLSDFASLVGLTDFVSRSCCDLSALHLVLTKEGHEITLDEALHISSLKTLQLDSSQADIENLLERLASPPSLDNGSAVGAHCLPNLETLILKTWKRIYARYSSFKWSLAASLFPLAGEQPGATARPFRHLALDAFLVRGGLSSFDDYYIPKDDIEAFQSAIDRGFSVKICNPFERNGNNFIETSRRYHAGLLSGLSSYLDLEEYSEATPSEGTDSSESTDFAEHPIYANSSDSSDSSG